MPYAIATLLFCYAGRSKEQGTSCSREKLESGSEKGSSTMIVISYSHCFSGNRLKRNRHTHTQKEKKWVSGRRGGYALHYRMILSDRLIYASDRNGQMIFRECSICWTLDDVIPRIKPLVTTHKQESEKEMVKIDQRFLSSFITILICFSS